MKQRLMSPLVFLCVLPLLILLKAHAHAEFYKYSDQEGRLHFVDDLSKIPPEYRDNITVYKEKYDHSQALGHP